MTGTPEGSTESSFMEKPGIEPATSGLQGIALIHYTTRASLVYFIGCSCSSWLIRFSILYSDLTVYKYDNILNTKLF